MLNFYDTRTGEISDKSFSQVVLQGLADSGGLFAPASLPVLNAEELAHLGTLSYAQAAAFVFERLGIDFDANQIAMICADSYGDNFDIGSVTGLTQLDDDTHILELWHGPTSAFKDMALQCMPIFFSASLAKEREFGRAKNDVLVLVATSGDTGKAALEGFKDRAGCSICVLFPEQGVSAIQRKQMVSQAGDNVDVIGVRGNFDDCQTMVKEVFNDREFAAYLESEHGLVLSSANSINFGRLMPQIVYYLTAPMQLAAAGKLVGDGLVDVVVPTGNFGNILAAYYAKKMGSPIGKLICASNENNILPDFIETGTYDISSRSFVETPSPSMDILISSNLERLLFHLSDSTRVKEWMESLRTSLRYEVDEETLGAIQGLMDAGYVTNDESLKEIKRIWDEQGYLMDPHTAVAFKVGQELRTKGRALLVVSTAHWAKFAADVLKGLSGVGYKDALDAELASHSEYEQLDDIAALARGAAPIPANIAELEKLEVRFKEVIDNKKEALLSYLKEALS